MSRRLPARARGARLALATAAVLTIVPAGAQSPAPPAPAASPAPAAGAPAAPAARPGALPGGRMVTQGQAKVTVENLYKCPVTVSNHRVSAVGTITATDGTVITMPARVQYGKGPIAADLYNECNQVTPAKSADVDASKVPVVEIDPDGEVITGYVVADNYFEFYVNGKLVGLDHTPYTPFNSAIVRFKAKKPYTMAFLLVDWDEQLGLGMELFMGNPRHPGDGGLIARFSDGTVTDSSWKAQTFYIAPLNTPDEVVETGNVHDTTALGRVHPVAKKPPCGDACYAVHYRIPDGWQGKAFDDGKWPRAYEYTDTDVGVRALPAYTRYPELFEGSRWIWSSNLVFDNVVIARKTVR
ncbi:hypothetical protein J2S22_005667 [Rhodoplanes tepidamans]|uniref:Uncharacterized protein n=2 Tax=Rhodoplanes TaxID=29407 RepID=A0ABT5JBY2_RHOTP|nr:hypothetical protein [Rhodoplanes tepidamans]MDC7787112.1 hypothetical protein [Rhodoplanes tepidamans]MDQ0358713.1 hypothetical protein [Rhodoplanes tepidamans]